MTKHEKEQLLNLLSWVSVNCSINVRRELRGIGLDPDGLIAPKKALDGVNTID